MEGEYSTILLVYLSGSSSQMAAQYVDTASPAATNVPASLPFILHLTGEITGEMGENVDIDEVGYSGCMGKRTGK